MLIQRESTRFRPHGWCSRRIRELLTLFVVCGATQSLSAQWTTGEEKPGFASARQVPANVLDGRSREVVILPSEPGTVGEDPLSRSQGAIGHVTPEAQRLPEGYIVAAREAQVERDGSWYVLHLASVEGLPDAPPLRVLPNRRLAMLDTILTSEHRDLRLAVTGRVTEFQGRNYILLEDLKEASIRTKPVVTEPLATQPEEGTSENDIPAKEPTAEEIMRRLMNRRPTKSLVMPDRIRIATSAPTGESDARDGAGDMPSAETTRWPEETMLMDRLGRVVPGEPWWSLAFEDRGTGVEVKPVRLLPNRLLENALAISGTGPKTRVIQVSGEITEHKGTNYLLLRKVLARRDMGNFR